MSTAAFKIIGSVSGTHLSSEYGAEVVDGETLTFQLEASPGLDVERVQFAIIAKDSAAAADLTLTPSNGVPTPTPLDGVAASAVSGVRTYAARCVVNGGVDKAGRVVKEWTHTRVFFTRTPTGLRKLTPGETTEGDPTYGWVAPVNELMEKSAGIGLVLALSSRSFTP